MSDWTKPKTGEVQVLLEISEHQWCKACAIISEVASGQKDKTYERATEEALASGMFDHWTYSLLSGTPQEAPMARSRDPARLSRNLPPRDTEPIICRSAQDSGRPRSRS
jgi:hypothetical protein